MTVNRQLDPRLQPRERWKEPSSSLGRVELRKCCPVEMVGGANGDQRLVKPLTKLHPYEHHHRTASIHCN